MPLDPYEVHAVAEMLSFEYDEIADPDWLQCRQGRWRSAVSRAYYSVFLALKEVVLQERPDWRFPEFDVHARTVAALEAMSPRSPGVLQAFNSLRRARRTADYDMEQSYLVLAATDAIDQANAALEEIADWTATMRADFAMEFVSAAGRNRR